jgi:hypothetical protein
MLQLKLNGISLQELIDFLHKIYTSKNLVVVYRVESLKPTPDNKGLDYNVVFMSPAKAPAA